MYAVYAACSVRDFAVHHKTPSTPSLWATSFGSGDHVDEPNLELTEDRLLLLDKDGKTKYDWRRTKKQQLPAVLLAHQSRLP